MCVCACLYVNMYVTFVCPHLLPPLRSVQADTQIHWQFLRYFSLAVQKLCLSLSLSLSPSIAPGYDSDEIIMKQQSARVRLGAKLSLSLWAVCYLWLPVPPLHITFSSFLLFCPALNGRLDGRLICCIHFFLPFSSFFPYFFLLSPSHPIPYFPSNLFPQHFPAVILSQLSWAVSLSWYILQFSSAPLYSSLCTEKLLRARVWVTVFKCLIVYLCAHLICVCWVFLYCLSLSLYVCVCSQAAQRITLEPVLMSLQWIISVRGRKCWDNTHIFGTSGFPLTLCSLTFSFCLSSPHLFCLFHSPMTFSSTLLILWIILIFMVHKD